MIIDSASPLKRIAIFYDGTFYTKGNLGLVSQVFMSLSGIRLQREKLVKMLHFVK
jgi:hypothetical protein